jgi:hypothetical protein
MGRFTVHLRYYPGDPLSEIRQEDLDRIADAHRVRIAFQKIDNRAELQGKLRETTLDRAIEDISQDIITVDSDDQANFLSALKVLYDRYRSPRTPYGMWGSTSEGRRMAKRLADETGGGW